MDFKLCLLRKDVQDTENDTSILSRRYLITAHLIQKYVLDAFTEANKDSQQYLQTPSLNSKKGTSCKVYNRSLLTTQVSGKHSRQANALFFSRVARVKIAFNTMLTKVQSCSSSLISLGPRYGWFKCGSWNASGLLCDIFTVDEFGVDFSSLF